MSDLFDRATPSLPHSERLELERIARTHPDPVTRWNANREANRQAELFADESIAEVNEQMQQWATGRGRGDEGRAR
jgi:hypothetical protein